MKLLTLFLDNEHWPLSDEVGGSAGQAGHFLAVYVSPFDFFPIKAITPVRYFHGRWLAAVSFRVRDFVAGLQSCLMEWFREK